jgi:AraC family cel operon transcriptional repressor
MPTRILEKERFVDMRTEISYRIVHSSSERFVEHAHDYYEAFVMLSGSVKHTSVGKSYKISAGDFVFIRPRDVHKFTPISDGEFSFINLTFTEKTFQDMARYLGDGFPTEALINAEDSPRACLTQGELLNLESKISYLSTVNHESLSDLKTVLRIMLIELITSHFYSYTAPTEKLPPWLEKLLVTMRNDSNFTLGLDRMIELSGKTREHLARTMKKHLGQTSTEYINELRLNYIANMLRITRKGITEIILESGFTSISRAAGLFKENYGLSMRDFRKNC